MASARCHGPRRERGLPGPQPEAAVALLAPVISANPLNEPAHRAMMRALARSGRRSEALIVFERLREVLAARAGRGAGTADAAASTRELLAGGPRGGQADGPGRCRTNQRDRCDLPAPVTPLLGRGARAGRD